MNNLTVSTTNSAQPLNERPFCPTYVSILEDIWCSSLLPSFGDSLSTKKNNIKHVQINKWLCFYYMSLEES